MIDAKERAQRLFKHSPTLQAKWIKAVEWLRTESKTGWHLDKEVAKIEPSKNVLGQ